MAALFFRPAIAIVVPVPEFSFMILSPVVVRHFR